MLVLQGLDVHSTLRAIDAGHHEQNPLMRWTVSHPAAFISMKAAASAATIYVAEKIRKRHPKRALLFMAAVNSAYALIVVHNYKRADSLTRVEDDRGLTSATRQLIVGVAGAQRPRIAQTVVSGILPIE